MDKIAYIKPLLEKNPLKIKSILTSLDNRFYDVKIEEVILMFGNILEIPNIAQQYPLEIFHYIDKLKYKKGKARKEYVAQENINYINNLFWIVLNFNRNFKMQLNQFKQAIKDNKRFTHKYDIGIDDLFSLEHDNEYIKAIEKTLNIDSFSRYRDDFYDNFGIDLVEYYNMYFTTEENLSVFKSKAMVLKSKKYRYPYKHHLFIPFKMDKPTHKFIKTQMISLEIPPYLEDSDLHSYVTNNYKKHLKHEYANILKEFPDYEEQEIKQKAMLIKKAGKRNHKILKKTFIVLYILDLLGKKSQHIKKIEQAMRLYNYYLLKTYVDCITIHDKEIEEPLYLSDLLKDKTIMNKYIYLDFNKKVPFSFIQNSEREKIKKFIRLLLD